MFLLALLLHLNSSFGKETRVLSFYENEVILCGKQVSWIALLAGLTLKEGECLDSLSPLSVSGASETLDRQGLIESLKKSRSECLGSSELRIPDKIRFKAQVTMTDEVLRPWVQDQLQAQYPERQIEVSKIQMPRVDCGKAEVVKWGSFRIDGKNNFQLLLMVGDKNFGVTGNFRLFQTIPIVLRNYSPNEKINGNEIEMQRRDVTFSPGYVSREEELIGRSLSYPVSQGEPIQLRYLKQESLVEKGQLIQVQFQGENFVVTSSALAEQSGALGDLIKVKNVDSQKLLSGVVSGKGLVEVH